MRTTRKVCFVLALCCWALAIVCLTRSFFALALGLGFIAIISTKISAALAELLLMRAESRLSAALDNSDDLRRISPRSTPSRADHPIQNAQLEPVAVRPVEQDENDDHPESWMPRRFDE